MAEAQPFSSAPRMRYSLPETSSYTIQKKMEANPLDQHGLSESF